MKLLNLGFRLALGTLVLLAGIGPGGAIQPVGATASPAVAPGGDLLAFQLVRPGAGWALMGSQLFWTDGGGARWRDITPPNLGTGSVRTARFADDAHGWVVSTAPASTGDLNYSLARTADGGQTWHARPLTLFSAGDAAGMAGDVFLQFIDARLGWLVVKQATSSNFNLGTLFKTTDGGDHWTRLSLPTAGPVQFNSALEGLLDASATGHGRYVTHDGGQTWVQQAGISTPNLTGPGGQPLSAVSMATAEVGWAKAAAGKCEAGSCMLVTKLLATPDGGQTWTPVSLPGGQPALEQTFAAPSAAAAPQGAGGLRVTYSGQGFDFCNPSNGGILPTPADMQNWYANSPYKVWNLYIGGSSRATCGTLTAAYIKRLAQQGWLFIPTWVGPQAPCTGYTHKIDYNTATAYNQGAAEADLARNVAHDLGLTLSDLSGSVIYYDIEYYSDNPVHPGCRDAVKAFISGWSGELRAAGDQSGVYGAPCGPSLSDFAQITNMPDMIWIARWNFPYAYDPNASVFGSSACGLDNTLWANHQRLHQYAGGHDEAWGGVSFNIDSDVIDANIAKVLVNCVPTWGQVGLFQYPDFNGQCALKYLGDYPTAASLGVPFSSIASLAVGATMTATLCQGAFFTSPCQDFTADVTDLSTQPVGNNPISSIRISTSLVLTNHVFIPIELLN